MLRSRRQACAAVGLDPSERAQANPQYRTNIAARESLRQAVPEMPISSFLALAAKLF